MQEKQIAFVISQKDNVATALSAIVPGKTELYGDLTGDSCMEAVEEICKGHKIALRDIEPGEDIIKYGVRIGRSTQFIKKGSWVHLHVMKSVYDERSSHLDVKTGAPKDIRYE